MAEAATAETPTPNPTGPSQPPSPPPPAPDPNAPTTPSGKAPDANLLAEAQRKQKAAEREAAEARKRVEELEDRDRTELERAQKKAADLEAQKAQAEAKAARLERNAWIRAAARAAGFHDPEDAVAHLSGQLEDLDTDAKAKKAVDDLAADESKSHLVGRRPEPTPMGALPADGTTPGAEPPGGPPNTEGMSDEERAKAAVGQGLLQTLTRRRQGGAGLGATTGRGE
jgi:hypothetical protein